MVDSGNLKHPHFSIHLQRVTVREALNTIAVQSYRIWQQFGWNIPNYLPDGQVIWDKDAPHIVPRGWAFHFVAPGSMSFQEWTRDMFRFLM